MMSEGVVENKEKPWNFCVSIESGSMAKHFLYDYKSIKLLWSLLQKEIVAVMVVVLA